jgi:S-adenosylmethionine decarboxylase
LNPLRPITAPPGQSTEAVSGLHIVANFSVANLDKLVEFQPFRTFIEEQIDILGLCRVGEVYHNFPGGGFTGVVCLTESHLSVHTWPEQHYLTFDVFLSNYLKDNRPVTRRLYDAVQTFFDATVLWEQSLDR